MSNLGRRWGDTVTYQRGGGSVERELEKVQSCLESLDPAVQRLEEDVRDLRSFRDSISGVLKVIAVLQVLIVGLIISLFSWGLNHMTFHSDYEQHSGVQSPQTSDSR